MLFLWSLIFQRNKSIKSALFYEQLSVKFFLKGKGQRQTFKFPLIGILVIPLLQSGKNPTKFGSHLTLFAAKKALQ